jgi:hypothetical protein
MRTKKCSKCRKIKPISEFYKRKNYKDGYCSQCKICKAECSKEYYKNNSEYYKNWRKNNSEKLKKYFKEYSKKNSKKIIERVRKWQEDNPRKVAKYKKRWQENNPEKKREANKNWVKNNPEQKREIYKRWSSIPKNRLSGRISALIRHSLKSNRKNRYWENLVGYTLKDLRKYLESKFKDGMNWQNYGKWEIDHKKPISSFNFSSYEDREFKKCWALDNLQPLWALENSQKGNKIL